METEKPKEATKLSNEYRDNLDVEQKKADPVAAELERVGEAEMLRRDMFAAMRNFQVMKIVTDMDKRHSLVAKDLYEAFVEELDAMPISEATMSLSAGIAKQVTVLEKTAAACDMSRANVVIQKALEAAIGPEVDTALDGTAKEAQDPDNALEETLEGGAGDECADKEEFSDQGDDSLDDEPGDVKVDEDI